MFGSLFSNINMKAASVKQEAASAVTPVDKKIKLTLSIVFVPHIDVHIQ